jgi:ppGpp synthetase/RelA/SpoT-type nucleotidyltranferase
VLRRLNKSGDTVALTELEIATLVEKYLRERDRYDKMATVVSRRLSTQLRAFVIPHVPTFRTKDSESLSTKLTRKKSELEYESLMREFAPDILDLAGVRILLYRPRDQEQTCELIGELFDAPAEERFHRDYLHVDGYQARHRVVTLRDEALAGDSTLNNLVGVFCGVQVVTIGDHIWNELEHDIVYKTPTGKSSDAQDSLLKVLRGQLNTVRTTVDQLMEATDRQRQTGLTAIENAEDLSDALKERSGRRLQGDFDQLLNLLTVALRRLTPAELERLPIDAAELEAARARLLAAGIDEVDGVGLVVGALWPIYGDDFVEIAAGWKGRPGPIARLLRALSRAATEGRI